MAKRRSSGDYFGIDYIISLILAILTPTALICGVITRLQEGKIVAAILRIILGWNIIWIADIIMMILHKKILRLLNV